MDIKSFSPTLTPSSPNSTFPSCGINALSVLTWVILVLTLQLSREPLSASVFLTERKWPRKLKRSPLKSRQTGSIAAWMDGDWERHHSRPAVCLAESRHYQDIISQRQKSCQHPHHAGPFQYSLRSRGLKLSADTTEGGYSITSVLTQLTPLDWTRHFWMDLSAS